MKLPPILANKSPAEPSVFQPANLLREARRQLNRPDQAVPATVVLDPDGDLCDHARNHLQAAVEPAWACYHSQMYSFFHAGEQLGIIPRVVGAPFAVLVAEQLFASGCRRVISITSAGIVRPPAFPHAFALITSARRDEGTSYHYLPPSQSVNLAPALRECLLPEGSPPPGAPYHPAHAWTTDAPYRETQSAIDAMAAQGVTCVEMEAAALYALAQAKEFPILCFAHLTNTMAQTEGDFDKGEQSGSLASLQLLSSVLGRLPAA